jgi:hypothetical protein
VVVQWSQLYDGSTTVTRYEITFLTVDGITFASTTCDGNDQTVIDDTECTVPSETFVQAPFNLMWGSSVYIKVVAFNIKGMSAESAVGNGALIWTVPDAPLNLRNVPYLTDYDTIGLLWDEASENGGTPVIDYRVSYKFDTEPYVELESNIVLLPYQVHQLTVGTVYTFKV